MVEKVGVEVLVIFPSSEKRVKQYVRKYSPPFRVAADPDQVVFQKFGSETSWAGDLRTAINLPKMMKAFARAKMNPLGVDDAPHRMPSEYLIDPDGEVAHVHYGQELDDGFPIREVMSWAEG
jgi:peroxiredoxin